MLDEPFVARGPFRIVPHTNDALVVAEIIVAPMALGLTSVAVVFTVWNAAMLKQRFGVEDSALRGTGRHVDGQARI